MTKIYSVIHPFLAMAQASRDNAMRMNDTLKMGLINDIARILDYLPERKLTFTHNECVANVGVIGFDEEGSWDNRGRAWLESVYMDGSTLLFTAHKDGSYRDNIKEIAPDAQDLQTLMEVHKAVCDRIADMFDIAHHKA